MASNLVAIALQDSNKTITGALKVDSEVLENIHEQFIKIATRQDIRVHSFQEARGMLGVKGVSGKVRPTLVAVFYSYFIQLMLLDVQIVGDFSSRLGLPDEPVETLNADHRQMVKCTGKDDDRYRAISGVLKQLLRCDARPIPSGLDSGSPPVSSSRNQGRPDTTQIMVAPVRTSVVPLTEEQPSNGQ